MISKRAVRAELEKRLSRYPRSLRGVRRLQLRNPMRYMQWHMLQLQLHALLKKAGTGDSRP